MHKKITTFALVLSAILFTGAGCISFSSNSASTTGPGGMFASSDAGETWKQISLLPTAEGVKSLQTVSVYDLVNDPTDPNTFYWASRGNGLFYTIDAGKSWQRAASPLNTGFIYSVAVHPQDHCTVFATNGTQVFRSTDCVRSWSEVYREAGKDKIRSIVINPASPFQIFLAKGKNDVLESVDGGVSWQVISRLPRTDLVQLAADPNEANVLYLATKSKGLYRSDDAGRTWIDVSEGLKKFPGGEEFRKLHVYPGKEGVVYWISTYGILRTEDKGVTWNPIQLIPPPGSARIYGFAVNEENEKEIYFAATVGVRSTFYKSIDGGQSWIPKKLPSSQVPTAIRIHPGKSDTLYLGFTIPPKK